jgi:hypothetical protein
LLPTSILSCPQYITPRQKSNEGRFIFSVSACAFRRDRGGVAKMLVGITRESWTSDRYDGVMEDTTNNSTPPVMTGQDRTEPAKQFTLTVEQDSELYAQLGHPRNPRSVRRFCQLGKLMCVETTTLFFTKAYAINKESVERHVQEINETQPRTEPVMTGQDRTEPANVRPEIATKNNDGQADITADNSKYVALLEKINEQQAKELEIKNMQIASMLEAGSREHILFQGLQTMLGRLLGSGEQKDKSNSHESTSSL